MVLIHRRREREPEMPPEFNTGHPGPGQAPPAPDPRADLNHPRHVLTAAGFCPHWAKVAVEPARPVAQGHPDDSPLHWLLRAQIVGRLQRHLLLS